jgi:hypothetical protein
MHHPDALPQGDARRWPARHGGPVGCFRHVEIVYPSDVLMMLSPEARKAKYHPRSRYVADVPRTDPPGVDRPNRLMS